MVQLCERFNFEPYSLKGFRMSHEFESGMFVGQGAWHGLGTVLQSAPTVEEAIRQAGLDWTVEEAPVYVRRPELDPVAFPFSELGYVNADRYKALVRSSDRSILSVVGAEYTPLQNAEAFAFFNPFLASGEATLETAGSLKSGRYVFISALIGKAQEVLPGDPILPYLFLLNAHTGQNAVNVLFTTIRPVCWNTTSAAVAEGEARNAIVKIRHHARVAETLKAVGATIDVARRSFALSLEAYRSMARRRLDTEGLKRFVKEVLLPWSPPPAATSTIQTGPTVPAVIGAPAVTMAQATEEMPRAWKHIEEAFHHGPGAELAGATVWGGYNAVTHWIDHTRGRTDEARFESSLMGEGRTIRDRAYSAALALVS